MGTESKMHNRQTHGMRHTKEYESWRKMKYRCHNPTNVSFKMYGGRGITVCERWLTSFENFIEDMGRMPQGKYSIDRIKNDGNYEPNNCRWATDVEQANNKRSNHLINVFGELLTTAQAALKYDISAKILRQRINRDKWEPERAILR